MLASQTLLSQLHIRYDGLLQPEVNDKAGAVLAAYDAQKAGTYHSPADLKLPELKDPGTGQPLDMQKLVDDPHSGVNPVVVDAMNQAVEDYRTACSTHQPLSAIHAAVDRVNALCPVTKAPAIDPDPDLVLLSSAPGVLGTVAQQLRNGEIFDPELMPVDQLIADAKAASGPANCKPTQF